MPDSTASRHNSTVEPSDVWFLVPVRAGSKGVPRKNVRKLAGTPLLQYPLKTLNYRFERRHIVVSTDDSEIARLAEEHATIHERDLALAADAATLDEVAVCVGKWLINRGANEDDFLITVQATSPFLRIESIEKAIAMLRKEGGSVISVREDRHLRWTIDRDGHPSPLYEERVNRQQLPPMYTETGGVIGTSLGGLLNEGTRIRKPIHLLRLDSREGLDIDTHADWAAAEFLAGQKRIVVRADSAPAIGMGHVYRAAAIAYEISGHDLTIVTRADGEFELGERHLKQYPFPVVSVAGDGEFIEFLETMRPDITILDVLDTTESFTKEVQEWSGFVVAFENLGPGANLADLVINDLYTDLYPRENHWYGIDYTILAPHFENARPRETTSEDVDNILVTFGGTDPSNLTQKSIDALERIGYEGTATVVVGPGYGHRKPDLAEHGLRGNVRVDVDNMAELMERADLAVTSGGRTVTELLTIGVPTVVCCQNTRELRHTHASGPFGVINLGLGQHVSPTALGRHVELLIEDPSLREDMRQRALKATRNRSNAKVVENILAAADDRETTSESTS